MQHVQQKRPRETVFFFILKKRQDSQKNASTMA